MSFVIEQNVAIKVSDVLVSNVTATSATFSWSPFDSNLEHVVSVNGQSCSILKPTIYRCLVTGLVPELKQTVAIRPKILRTGVAQSVSVTFKTLKLEIPDPPDEVQVEAGPQQGTLLVTWSPVKPNGRPPNSLVVGYSVYIDGRRIKELSSPNGDHIVLSLQDFGTIQNPHQITIRATTGSKESFDSAPAALTKQLLSELQFLVHKFHTSTTQPGANQLSTSSSWQPQLPKLDNTSPAHNKDTRTPTLAISSTNSSSLQPGTKPGSIDSGFSAALLSPLELRFPSGESDSVRNGYDSQNKNSASSRARHHSGKAVRTVPGQDGIPVIEITNGSFSDSSYDVDSEENFDRRKNTSSGGGGGSSGTMSHGAHVSAPSLHHNGSPRAENRRHAPGGHSSRDGYDRRDGRKHTTASRFHGQQSESGNRGKATYALAICDYDPATMSPNPDGVYEEIPFKEGQIVKIWGAKDADGFYMGESNGLSGLVPSNMVSEVHDPDLIEQYRRNDARQQMTSSGGALPPVNRVHRPAMDNDVSRRGDHQRKFASLPTSARQHQDPVSGSFRCGPSSVDSSVLPARRMTAMYTYEPHPSQDVAKKDYVAELSFQAGEGFLIYGEPDEAGFYYGQRERDGRRGYVPSNYFRDAGSTTRDTTSFRDPAPSPLPLSRQNIATDDRRTMPQNNMNSAEVRSSSHGIGQRNDGNDYQSHDNRRVQNIGGGGAAAMVNRDLGGHSSGVRNNSGDRSLPTSATRLSGPSGGRQSSESGAMYDSVNSRSVVVDSSGNTRGAGGGAIMDSSMSRGVSGAVSNSTVNRGGGGGGGGSGDMSRRVDRPPETGMEQKRHRP